MNEPNEVAEVVEEVEIEATEIDENDFDLSTPAEFEARRAQVEEAEEEVEEAEAPEAPAAEEKKLYQAPQKIQLQAKPFEGEIPVDEYGNIDPTKLGEYLQSRDEHLKESARIEAQNAYYENVHGQREWNDVGEAYPELVSNETTRNLIENLRVADAIRGGQGNLMEAAKQLDDQRKEQFNLGAESQKSSITRQKSVTLKGSSRSSAPRANDISNLRKKAMSGGADSESARLSYISSLIDSGAFNS